MRVDLRLLGYPRLEIDGREVDFRLQKGLALIAFVAEARAPIARDAVSALLWPDLDEDAARARLRRTLHRIRQAFGAEFIAADRISLRFDPAVRFSMDAAAFEAACDEDRFADAVQLYHRDFLSGLSLAGCEEFEEWAFFRREALRSRLVQALERLVERGLAAGDARAALSSAIRLVGLDPFSEAAHRHVIRAHLMAGDRSAAERQYEACRKLLAEELRRVCGFRNDGAACGFRRRGGRSSRSNSICRPSRNSSRLPDGGERSIRHCVRAGLRVARRTRLG